MMHWRTYSRVRKVLILIGVTVFSIVCIYYGYMQGPLEAVAKNSAGENELPIRGKLRQPTAPKNAVFGMIYINTKDTREYIFDGAQWVPHDNSVEEFYRQKDRIQLQIPKGLLPSGTSDTGTGAQPLSLQVNEVLPAGDCGTGTGAHTKHAAFDCLVCHYVGGVLCFDINGPAVSPGNPLPSFDATAKTCSSIACHGMYSGTFSYYFPGGDGEPELKTVSYAGSGGSTPSWYTTGLGCTACHGNPPPAYPAWHGWHANRTSGSNDCQLCHNDPTKPTPYTPIASGTGGVGTTINTPAQHGNGTVTVYARFASRCFGCH